MNTISKLTWRCQITSVLHLPGTICRFSGTYGSQNDEITKNEKATDDENPPALDSIKSKHSVNQQKEINGPKGPEPTRFGDWERKGRISDF